MFNSFLQLDKWNLPVTITVGEDKFVNTPFRQSIGQPTFVRSVRNLHLTEALERRMWYDDLFHCLAQREHRVVFTAKIITFDDDP